MVAAVYILHWPDPELEFRRSEVLLHRNYVNDIPDAHALVSRFNLIYKKLEAYNRSPCIHDNGLNYIYIWGKNDIMFLTVARTNINVMLTTVFLSQFYLILERYFKLKLTHGTSSDSLGSSVSRDTIVDNFPLIYELLDECMDFGVIQLTDYNILKEYIKMEVNLATLPSLHAISDSESDMEQETSKKSDKSEKKKKSKKKEVKSTHNHAVHVTTATDHLINSSILRTQSLAVSWRPKGIFYLKNEIYIDINESCEFLYDLESDTVKINEVRGYCAIRSYLSGMPVCKLGLNEKYISQVEHEEIEEDEKFEEEEEKINMEGNMLVQNEDANSDEEGGIDGETVKTAEEDQKEVKEKIGIVSQEKDDENTPAQQSIENETSKSSDSENTSKNKTVRKLKVPISNVQFHQCTELSSLYKKNLIVFTPPDDEFELLSYKVEQRRHQKKKPLIMIQPKYRIHEQKVQIMCTLSTSFKRRLHCRNLVVRLPVDPNIFELDESAQDDFRFRAELGEVQYKVDSSEILWKISDLPGSRQSVRMMAEVVLGPRKVTEESVRAVFFNRDSTSMRQNSRPDSLTELGEEQSARDSALEELDRYYGVGGANTTLFRAAQRENGQLADRNASVEFEIPMFTYSGLKVTYLRVEEDVMKYTCFPWVRYVTRGGRDCTQYRFKIGPLCFEWKE